MAGLSLRDLLAFAGRNGPTILCGGVLIGVAFPFLASAAKPLMSVAVFVFTLGAFLKVDWPSFQNEVGGRKLTIGLALLWTVLGVPAAMLAIQAVFHPADADLKEGLLLKMLAPPVGSAAAIAAMLGLSAPLALFTTVVATVVSPFLLPPLAALLTGQELAIDPLAMMLRLLVIVGGACATAVALRRWCGAFVRNNPHAMTGVAVLGLILVAVGAMHGMRDMMLAEPERVGLLLGIAFAVNIAFQIIGTALFWSLLGPARALTVGLVSGSRNVTLIWAAAGPSLQVHPGVELYLAMSVFPIFMLPLFSQAVISHLLALTPPWQMNGVANMQAGTATDADAAASEVSLSVLPRRVGP